MLSKTNSITKGPYTFIPSRYATNNDLYCALYRNDKCVLTGRYDFNEEKFKLIFVSDFWKLNKKHMNLLTMFLNEYDWSL